MLSRLFITATRTGSRALLSKPIVPNYFAGHRSFYSKQGNRTLAECKTEEDKSRETGNGSADEDDKKGEEWQEAFTNDMAKFAFVMSIPFGAMTYSVWEHEERTKWKRTEEKYHQSILWTPEFPKDMPVLFSVSNHPWNGVKKSYTASISIKGFSLSKDYIMICAELKQVGITAERSVQGARDGLLEYATKKLLESLQEQGEKKWFDPTEFDEHKEEIDYANQGLFVFATGVFGLAVGLVGKRFRAIRSSPVLMYARLIFPALPFGGLLGYFACHFAATAGKGWSPAPETTGVPEAYRTDCRRRMTTKIQPHFKSFEKPMRNQSCAPYEAYAVFRFPTIQIDDSELCVAAEVEVEMLRRPKLPELNAELKPHVTVEMFKDLIDRGLTRYALTQMHQGLEKHVQKTCRCYEHSVTA